VCPPAGLSTRQVNLKKGIPRELYPARVSALSLPRPFAMVPNPSPFLGANGIPVLKMSEGKVVAKCKLPPQWLFRKLVHRYLPRPDTAGRGLA
jgi:hypothetical protein